MTEAVFCIPAVFLCAALLIHAAGRRLPFYGMPVALTAALYALAISAGLFKAAVQDSVILPAAISLSWFSIPFMGSPLALRLDGMAMLALFAVSAAGTMAQLVSAGLIVKDRFSQRYFTLLSLFMAGATGVILADNLLLVLLCWEVSALAATGLITHRYQRPEHAASAKQFFLISRLGGLLLLGAIITAFAAMGTMSIDQLLKLHRMNFTDPVAVQLMAALILGAVICRTGILPFMSAQSAAAAAPAPAGAVIVTGSAFCAVYLLARLAPFFSPDSWTSVIALWLGLAGGVAAAVCAITERDIIKAAAFCAAAEMSVAVAAFGAGGAQQAVFHAFCAVFSGAMLITAAGLTAWACKKGDLHEMGGLSHTLPTIHLVFLTGAAALAGLPPLSGFFAKTLSGGVFQQMPGAFAAALAVYLLTAMAVTRMVLLAFHGEKGKLAKRAQEYEGPISTLGTIIFAAITSAFIGWMFTRSNIFSAMLSMAENPMPFNYTAAALTAIATLAGITAAIAAYNKKPDWLWKRLTNIRLPQGDGTAALEKLGTGAQTLGAALDRAERTVDGGFSSVWAKLPKAGGIAGILRAAEAAVFRMPDSVTDMRPQGDSMAANAVLAAAGLVTILLIMAALG